MASTGLGIAVTGSAHTVAVWDLRKRTQLGLMNHHSWVHTVAVGHLDGRPMAVAGTEDGTLWVWDLRGGGSPISKPLAGHSSTIDAVAVGEMDGLPIAVTGGYDYTVRVWDLRRGKQIGKPLTGHNGWVRGVIVGEVVGRPIAVSGSWDGSVRVWNLITRRVDVIELDAEVQAIANVPPSGVLVASKQGVALLHLRAGP